MNEPNNPAPTRTAPTAQGIEPGHNGVCEVCLSTDTDPAGCAHCGRYLCAEHSVRGLRTPENIYCPLEMGCAE